MNSYLDLKVTEVSTAILLSAPTRIRLTDGRIFAVGRESSNQRAIIHSVRENRLEVLQSEPCLEIIAGPWERGQTQTVPANHPLSAIAY